MLEETAKTQFELQQERAKKEKAENKKFVKSQQLGMAIDVVDLEKQKAEGFRKKLEAMTAERDRLVQRLDSQVDQGLLQRYDNIRDNLFELKTTGPQDFNLPEPNLFELQTTGPQDFNLPEQNPVINDIELLRAGQGLNKNIINDIERRNGLPITINFRSFGKVVKDDIKLLENKELNI